MLRVLWVFIATLTLPASASAAVVRAEAVLPPGQSGHVAITGITTGQGSPHLYDQTQRFIDFDWRPFGFHQAASEVEEPKPGVRIERDAFGVPNVIAGSMEDGWFGVGYAVAQDRLFQLELFRRATTGRLAEILGKGYLDDDLVARRDYYTRPELEAMFNAVPPRLLAQAQAYREGVNAWIAETRSDPTKLPGEMVALGVLPDDFETWEQAAIGVFLARTVPSGNGNELDNLELLRGAGRKALDALVPLRRRREVYTVRPSEGRFASVPGRTRRQERRALVRTARVAKVWDLPTEAAEAAAGTRSPSLFRSPIGGSYMFAAVDRDTKRAVIYNGPQLGYSVPELFVEWELHYPGHDIRGVGAAGVPVVGIGHNGDVAWGFTSGLSDEDDLFAEELVEDERYRFKGEVRDMDCRDETFRYQTPAPDVAGGDAPERGEVTERICRTVHGPVQLRAGDTAYARRYAIWGREIESIVGLDMLNTARTIQDVDAAMRAVTWNENVIAIDSQGQLGYWHPGLHPIRSKRWDERLPLPGTGEAEWRRLRSRARTPHVVNPKSGWLANWNNVPAKGWTSGDAVAPERLTGRFHRAAFLKRLVREWAKAPSFDGAQRLVMRSGTTAQQRPLASGKIRRALRGSSGQARKVLETLAAWDGDYHRTDENGTVHPGVVIWEELKDELESVALARLSDNRDAMEAMASETSSSHEFDISNGEAYALRTVKPRHWRRAASEVYATLSERFEDGDTSAWRTPRKMYKWQAQGVGKPPPLPFFDRGTWEQFVELRP